MEAESKLKVYESGDYPKISDEVMKKAEENQLRFEVDRSKMHHILYIYLFQSF
mgnify:CR=1 FL=1